jgi:hypothetical protein
MCIPLPPARHTALPPSSKFMVTHRTIPAKSVYLCDLIDKLSGHADTARPVMSALTTNYAPAPSSPAVPASAGQPQALAAAQQIDASLPTLP